MKLSRKVFLALLLVVLAAGSVYAGPQNFTLYNYSGKTIYRIYLIPSWKPSYEDKDKFTGRGLPLSNGSSVKLNFNSYPDEQYWDLRVYFRDGSYWNWSDLDLFRIYNISIDKKGTIHWNF